MRYDFQCQQCSQEFELELTLKEQEQGGERRICPHCQSSELTQLITGGAVLSGGLTKSFDAPAGGSGCAGGGCVGGQCPF
ncbi:MAG: zinc ribbon domain-containing protein [Bdellovibrionales bacterium]|jgi:putative FmdB family regulatory protein|nr:zinc ribbon domain-containing protein [Bdellovibrionales bacterium]MBT3526574.1 zinc ribbon domain-containing protein [Bdellovibrionales bacterium]MBT7669340.1 zinc ribbon domain-containing protein [Bdellovibrionales bacterium]MBT7766904.1 zinc ribbon domain-containing protein [Bdellovibrionales bacterium]